MDELEAILETSGAAAVEIVASALAERGGPALDCANCGHPLIGPYCAICGQPHNTHRRSVGHLLHDFFKDIVNFDSRILRTARALLLQPGELPQAFHEGRTQRYMPAVRLYLFVSLLFFLFLSVSGIAIFQFGVTVETSLLEHDKAGHVFKVENGKRTQIEGLISDADGNISVAKVGKPVVVVPGLKADGSINNSISTKPAFFQKIGSLQSRLTPAAKEVLDKLRAEERKDIKGGESPWLKNLYASLERLVTDPAALNGQLTTWIPRILFFLLPMFAVLLALFYRRLRKEFYFVDHLVFSLNVHTFAFAVLIAAAAAAQSFPGQWVALLTILVLSVYVYLALKRFYGQGWIRTGLKFAGLTFIYTVFILLPALGGAIVASVLAG
jgi:hypothetical protein